MTGRTSRAAATSSVVAHVALQITATWWEAITSCVVNGDSDYIGERLMTRSVDSGQNGPERKHRSVSRLEWDDY